MGVGRLEPPGDQWLGFTIGGRFTAVNCARTAREIGPEGTAGAEPTTSRPPPASQKAVESAARLLVAEAAEDLEDLAPGREHPAALLLVLVHRQHELHLGLRVFALAGRRVDEPPPAADLPALAARVACSVARRLDHSPHGTGFTLRVGIELSLS